MGVALNSSNYHKYNRFFHKSQTIDRKPTPAAAGGGGGTQPAYHPTNLLKPRCQDLAKIVALITNQRENVCRVKIQ